MKENLSYQEDLASVRNLMERSSKFISLSGLSGILSGVYALAGAGYAYQVIYDGQIRRTISFYFQHPQDVYQLCVIAFLVLICSLATGVFLSLRKAKRKGQSLWTISSRKLLINLLVPLVAGGLFTLILLSRGYFGIIAPSLLIFYGLALMNASANLFDEIRYLAYSEIILGLVAAFNPGYGLLFWAIGFGALHIFYGALMYRKYDR
jgi:predicted lysophospholipase L1 biosynthesis ABC-type transport system permease subunit